MTDTREFDKIADEWKELNLRIRELRPAARNAAIESYRAGVPVVYITERLGASTASLYNWLREAGPGVFSDTPQPIGRPRKNMLAKARVVPKKVFENADFAWFDDRVRVDCNGKRVLIDTDRLEFEGDRGLGQVLVNGSDLGLIRSFNEFVNGG